MFSSETRFSAVGCFDVGLFAEGQFAVRTVHRMDPCIQNSEDTIAKYAVDANLFRLGSTNLKKISSPGCFWCPYGHLSHGTKTQGEKS